MKLADEIAGKIGLENLWNFIYPPLCLSCDAFMDEADSLVCQSCWQKCTVFDYPLCFFCRRPLDSSGRCQSCQSDEYVPVFALGEYVDPLKKIIHNFKYRGYKKLGNIFAQLMLEKFKLQLEKLKINVILPVPLHSYREKVRGFNQAALLSDNIGNGLKLPVAKESLRKVKRTADQAKLDFEHRMKNLRGAFAVVGEDLKEKRVLIVDDVVTSGATVLEAIRVLEKAGARIKGVCAVAITGD